MTPQQALDILNQATSTMTLNRAGHAQLQTAIQVLHVTLNPPAKPATPALAPTTTPTTPVAAKPVGKTKEVNQ